ncbi:MAG: hypothetical protein LBG52_02380 [Candidatus Peribacteria bacterium]|nr:hypothetical protein [Candidatus Peribacteria bacterium]
MTYSLITLPNLPTFDSIREYLYTHNFRYTNKLPTDPAHITLSQLNLTTEYNVHHLKSLLRKQLQNHSPFSLSQRTLINQEHKWISNPPQRKERYPQ